MQAEGHSMKSGEMPQKFYRAIQRHFGGWKEAKKELGIVVKKTAFKCSPKYSDEEVVATLTTLSERNATRAELHADYRWVYEACRVRWGGLDNACSSLNIRPLENRERKPREVKWTKVAIDRKLCDLSKQGASITKALMVELGISGIVNAAVKEYGSWNSALMSNGIIPAASMTTWTKVSTLIELRSLINKGVPFIGARLDEHSPGIHSAVTRYLGGIEKGKEHIGVCLIKDKPKEFYPIPVTTPKDRLVSEIKARHKQGSPLNYTAIKKTSIHERAKKYFGSWSNAVEASGIPYDKVRVDTKQASFQGYKLEELFEELLSLLGLSFSRDGYKELKPDFILSHNRWIDVKLSEWTTFSNDCKTIERYSPHCKQLTIVYLRGRNSDVTIAGGVRLVNIKQYIKQVPRQKRGYFYAQIRNIETALKSNAS